MMKVGKSTRYALYAAMELARAPEEGPGGQVTSAEIAARYAIPPAVLAKVLQRLVRERIAVATRGAKGGYRLERPASKITVLEVMDAMEPRRDSGACLLDDERSGECGHGESCRLRRLFDEVDELARCTFASITLETLVRAPRPGGLGVLLAPPRRGPLLPLSPSNG